MDTSELTQLAERQLADGSRSASRTLERTRRKLLQQRDAAGLEHLLELADRLDAGTDLTHAIRQNLKLLNEQAEHERTGDHQRGRMESVVGGTIALLVVLAGALGGAAAGIYVTYLALSGERADALVWFATGVFCCAVGILVGGGLAFLLLPLTQRSVSRLVRPSR